MATAPRWPARRRCIAARSPRKRRASSTWCPDSPSVGAPQPSRFASSALRSAQQPVRWRTGDPLRLLAHRRPGRVSGARYLMQVPPVATLAGRRAALILGAAVLALPALAGTTIARPARIIAGLPPGSTTDGIARLLADSLRELCAADRGREPDRLQPSHCGRLR